MSLQAIVIALRLLSELVARLPAIIEAFGPDVRLEDIMPKSRSEIEAEIDAENP